MDVQSDDDRASVDSGNYVRMPDALARDGGVGVMKRCSVEPFTNMVSLARDMRFLAGMPELCDVLFLVGEERLPVYGVKAVLAIRSRVFYKMLFGPNRLVGRPPVVTNYVGRKLLKIIAYSQSRAGGGSATTNNCDAGSMRRPGVTNTLLTRPSVTSHFQENTIVINDFEGDVFKQLVEFIHTGSINIQPSTVLGLMNAADHFVIEDLRKACSDYARRCISLESVCPLLVTAERYIQYKSTKMFIQRLLEFVDEHGEEVLARRDFAHLPQHIVQLVLSRDELNASELTKYRTAERWAAANSSSLSSAPSGKAADSYNSLMRSLVESLALERLPTPVLMTEIKPRGHVSDEALMTALACQADPSTLRVSDRRQRRRTVVVPQLVDCTATSASSGSTTASSSGYDSRDDRQSIKSYCNGATLIQIHHPAAASKDTKGTAAGLKSKSVSDLTCRRIGRF